MDLFEVIGEFTNGEICNVLFKDDKIRIEHVAMPSKRSPEGFWYDTKDNEWGYLIKGHVKFKYQDNIEIITHKQGDIFFIPAHTIHRIEGTSSDCIVLCVFELND